MVEEDGDVGDRTSARGSAKLGHYSPNGGGDTLVVSMLARHRDRFPAGEYDPPSGQAHWGDGLAGTAAA